MTITLNSILDILAISVGIFSIVSVSVVGFQYLTAGNSQIKIQKSKHRLYEIIIGFTVYAIISIILHYLPK